MSNLTDKTTVYLHPEVKQFIKHTAVEEGRSVSEIINDHFADLLEDIYDIKDIEKRRKEPTVSFESVLNKLGLTYEDLRS